MSEEGIEANTKLPLEAAQPIVELDEVVNAFDASSRRALRQVLDGLGTGFAGRGADVQRAGRRGARAARAAPSASPRT